MEIESLSFFGAENLIFAFITSLNLYKTSTYTISNFSAPSILHYKIFPNFAVGINF